MVSIFFLPPCPPLHPLLYKTSPIRTPSTYARIYTHVHPGERSDVTNGQGRFLGNAPESVNTTRCAANGTHGYDWYEYSGSPLTCTPGFHRCQTRAVGWQVPGVDGGPAKLIVDHDYEGLRFTLGPGEAETLHASYYNAKGGMLAIGTRRMVTGEECVDAYRTMKRVRKEHAVKLAFELRDPCGGMGKLEEEEELVVEVPGPGPLAEKVRLWGKALAQRLGLGSKDEL